MCPECSGTGFVFVMTERDDGMPLKRRLDRFDLAGRQRCGLCGGDGVLGALDQHGIHRPDDWYITEKCRLAADLK